MDEFAAVTYPIYTFALEPSEINLLNANADDFRNRTILQSFGRSVVN